MPRLLTRLFRDRRGGTLTTFAIALPALATLAFGVIDLASVHTDKSRLQDLADATALAAAKQLSIVDDTGIAERAKSAITQQLAPIASRLNYGVTTTIAADKSNVTVAIDGTRTSFFGNMLPPGGWPVHVKATAATMAKLPLCVLSTGQTKADELGMKDSAKLTAPDCLVHSNGDVSVDGVSWLQAAATQASGVATGRISPAPYSSAPEISDPFDGINLKIPLALCTPLDLLFVAGVQVLSPGVHCGNLKAMKSSTVQLLPGEHYFMRGTLALQDNSVLTGDNVVMIFDKDSTFAFTGSSQIRLRGRRSGDFSGFVIATTRANTNTFSISSTAAREILGTIYIPAATLQVDGSGNTVADQSAWTVVVAKSLKMTGSANLVVNANYNQSSVPVPHGVGPSAGVVLAH